MKSEHSVLIMNEKYSGLKGIWNLEYRLICFFFQKAKLFETDNKRHLVKRQEILLSREDYDSYQSSIEIKLETNDEDGNEIWRSYRKRKLYLVLYLFIWKHFILAVQYECSDFVYVDLSNHIFSSKDGCVKH